MVYLDSDTIRQMWTFTGGSILILLQSLLYGFKRNWWRLLLGCALGGTGSLVAAHIWANSKYLYIICGVAAVMAENLLLGFANASREFARHPIKVASTFAQIILPVIFSRPPSPLSDIEEGFKK